MHLPHPVADKPAVMANRRRHRSDDRLLAVTFQLEQLLEDFDIEACLLTDELGVVLATAHASTEAFARALAIKRALEPEGEDFVQQGFCLGATRVVVTVVGADLATNRQAARRAIEGVTRIHATTHAEAMRADLCDLELAAQAV